MMRSPHGPTLTTRPTRFRFTAAMLERALVHQGHIQLHPDRYNGRRRQWRIETFKAALERAYRRGYVDHRDGRRPAC